MARQTLGDVHLAMRFVALAEHVVTANDVQAAPPHSGAVLHASGVADQQVTAEHCGNAGVERDGHNAVAGMAGGARLASATLIHNSPYFLTCRALILSSGSIWKCRAS